MDRTSLLQLIEPLLLEGKQILLSQLNRLLPVDLSADELDTIFLTLDEEGIGIVDDAVVLKQAMPSVKAELTQKTTPDPLPPEREEQELATNQRWYQREITKIPRLTEEEERHLGELALSGNTKAADTLVQANLRLVVSVAKRYVKSGVNLMDLIQAGNEGLIEASNRFDPSKGARFASFARWWIRQAIVRAISASWQAIRIPKNLSRECHRVVQARDVLKRKNGRQPSAKEVAEATGFPLEHVEFLDSLIQIPLSLDAPIAGMDGVVLESTIADEKAAEPLQESVRQSVREVLSEVFEKLDLTQRRILALRFGIDDQNAKSVEEVAKMTGMSRDKVRQIERQAIRKLRTIAQELKLEPFLRSHMPQFDDEE
jgi:RNA polymerase primary sigma factor